MVLDRSDGEIFISGDNKKITNPGQAIRQGIALVPEERRTQGLCTALPVASNIPMMNYQPIITGNLLSSSKESALAKEYIKKLSIACRSENQTAAFLSGGNQQKVVFSKCLNSKASVLLLDEPTRGVDVGAKQEIFTIIRELALQGNSVIVFSSELPEVLGLCDRIGLLFDGELKTIIENGPEVDTHEIMHIVTGGG